MTEAQRSLAAETPVMTDNTKQQIYYRAEDALRQIGDSGTIRIEEFNLRGILDVHARTDVNGESGDIDAKKHVINNTWQNFCIHI